MAYIAHQSRKAGIAPDLPAAGLAGTVWALWTRVAEWRQRRRTNRVVSSLPMDLQKDIGWPGGYQRRDVDGR
ncbi:hypothetical protein [Rhizobium halophytocola]|uniref:DUF1127 domain-containing protein n=1 Tax=Rhizobium halophytocola TaxID=735519 RepID=A0ABS4DZU4_9HYPH|nr:hypothetical protein [Rhizobium halophytocola]MBP1851204.1 hypothetical protein [Rhizobium halophytocola]